MPINLQYYNQLKLELGASVTLIAVSKTKSIQEILSLYQLGQRDFGENYVQELVEKQKTLPDDIRWHFIGHLQKNKVKYIAPFIHCIQVVDSVSLLAEINKQATKFEKNISCFLQIHIAKEETKFGIKEDGIDSFLKEVERGGYKNVSISGIMGMASLTMDDSNTRSEFRQLNGIFEKMKNKNFQISQLSMGMSSDYKIAIEEGATMVRIGSLLFGERTKMQTT